MKPKKPRPVALVVMDGWGVAPPGPYNAIHLARTNVLNRLYESFPNSVLAAHGRSVGLPEGQMGNSEVGHLNLGAGRVVKQELVRIDEAIEDGSFFRKAAFEDAINKIKAARGSAHLIGLCSPGKVHSSLDHMYALVDLLSKAGIAVKIHAITDGRDTPPRSAIGYFEEIERCIEGKAEIATVAGRFYSMDRDNRWDRIEKGYLACVSGLGQRCSSALEAIKSAYDAGENDEFILPRVIERADREPRGSIRDGDGVFFFNFRADRTRELTMALTAKKFDSFERTSAPKLSSCVSMTEYQADFDIQVAFLPHSTEKILGQVVSEHGLRQLRCAETEKYAHVTFFFNGGNEVAFENEKRILIPSPKEVSTYDLKPEMSASEVADAVIKNIEDASFILVNFANGDMVGHTGILEASIKAVETVDAQIGRLVEAVVRAGGSLIITADHGNIEKMLDEETKQPHTAHTTNPVPVILVDEKRKGAVLRQGGSLQDVAPTVLDLLELPKPDEMTGRSLIAAKPGSEK